MKSRVAKSEHHVASPRVLLFAAAFLLIFGGTGAWHFIRSLEPLTWKSVPCEILGFNPTDDPKSDHPFSAEVLFRFRWRETDYQGKQLGIVGWKDARDQLRQQLRFERDAVAKCYLPDGEPANAVLFRPSPKWAGLSFVAFSLCVGWILYQAHGGRSLPRDDLTPRILPAVAILFGGAGVFMTLAMSLPVWTESLQVRSWEETPATVVWSERRHYTTGGKNRRTVHQADICYEYEAAGRIWRNNRLYPGNLRTGGLAHADTLLSKHRPGTRVTCYIDPKRPERAVLMANPGWAVLSTLFPLPFLAIGFLCLKGTIRPKNKKSSGH